MAISIADSTGSPTRALSLLRDLEKAPPPKQSMWHRLGFGFGRWLGRDDSNPRSSTGERPKPLDNLSRRLSRRVGVSLPRPATFKRQNSERRDRLAPIEPGLRRAVSADRRRTQSVQRTRSPQPAVVERLSAPEVHWRDHAPESTIDDTHDADASDPPLESTPFTEATDAPEGNVDAQLEMELEKRWILNLSMHFRDKSEREKFFVTYAEAPNRWRRVTVSCDYRGAPPDSLEQDLKELHYQRDKSARIYESIRESLPEIQFYDTVTNLKLETSSGRLHVHVTEDVNEIIPYPGISSVRHLDTPLIPESHLNFDAHLSGFVYKVLLGGKEFIKKEIPGPDTVDEFLYEINALHALRGSESVIQLEGIIVNDTMQVVKGLLISFAEQGALVDILYERRGEIEWAQRERWAKQIVQGLSEIHEAGYVQGDFTLSNIVVGGDDKAKIIDINRRGCPVGWEPPEIATKIESNQRISMYIGVKSDIFQLGMTLWALAMQEDEPERQSRPLTLDADAKVPDYYRKLVATCLSPLPKDRLSTKELLAFFPQVLPEDDPLQPNGPAPGRTLPQVHDLTKDLHAALETAAPVQQDNSVYGHPISDVVYMDHLDLVSSSQAGVDYLDSPQRGRQPSPHAFPLSQYPSPSPSPYPHVLSGSRSLSHSHFEPPDVLIEPHQEPRFEDLEISEDRYIVPQDSDNLEEFRILGDQPHLLHRTENLQDPQSSNPSGAIVPHATADDNRENEIDLDETVDPLYRDSRPINREDLEPLHINALPGVLAGVGGNPACSIGRTLSQHSARYEPTLSSPPTYHPATYSEPKISEISDCQGQTSETKWPNDGLTRADPSLLDSKLPINPAFTWSNYGPTCQTSSLINSRLPINPAFTAAILKTS